MAKRPIAEAWLRQINAPKSENESHEKEFEKSESLQAQVWISPKLSTKSEDDSSEKGFSTRDNAKTTSCLNLNNPHESPRKEFGKFDTAQAEHRLISQTIPKSKNKRGSIADRWLRTVNAHKSETDSTENEYGETVTSRRLAERKTSAELETSAQVEPPRHSRKHKTFTKEQVIVLFQKLETFFKTQNFDEDLDKQLQKSNPNYMDILEKRRQDMEKTDHGIVIAGETSAGKSTLINKILGKRIFQGRTFESTSTICKIRNSKTVTITAELTSGEKNDIALTKGCDPDTLEGESELRETLAKLTNLTSSENHIQYRSVDIGFPIPFLKGDTILVDTPGIGGSGQLTEKLMKYLPNAVSFIFVINVGSAGGLQRDRLPEIMKEISFHKMDDEMPCFDPRDVLFVTNKWDTLYSENTDEDEEAIVWKKLLPKIKELWPLVNEKHIFKMSLKEVSPGANNKSVIQFEEFKKELNSNIKKAEHSRIIQHLSFLQDLLKTVATGVRARLDSTKIKEEMQQKLVKKHIEKIKTLTEKCTKTKADLLEEVQKEIERTAHSYYDYMSTDFGKERILNPPKKTPMLKVDWRPTLFSEKINKRICKSIDNFLNSEDVKKRFDNIKHKTESFYKEVCLEISEMETDWKGKLDTNKGTIQVKDQEGADKLNHQKTTIELNNKETTDVDKLDDEISTGKVVGVVVASSPIWVPLVATGIGLGVAFAGITLALSPVLLPLNAYLGRDERKKKLIDEEYDNCKGSVRSQICNHLESDVGVVLTKHIEKMIGTLLPRRIEGLSHMTEKLRESRNAILAKHGLLLNLESKIKEMEENIKQIKK